MPSTRDILAWATYLACSWTWCIGMFLPVLLVRDYGPWSFFVFAFPNVVGAAAMGWILRDRSASTRLVARHAPAIRAFSAVTLAFHAVFALWLVSIVSLPLAVALAIGVAIPVTARALSSVRDDATPNRAVLVRAALTLAVSLAAVVAFVLADGPTQPVLPQPNPQALVWLAPICAFGFASCPYLDPTFHHARQQLPARAGSVAFTLGFGVIFLAMILFTFVYAGWFLSPAPDSTGRIAFSLAGAAVMVHVGAQLAFTSDLHFRHALGSAPSEAGAGSRRPGAPLVVALVLSGIGAMALLPRLADLSPGEVVYRAFMAFYALVFPAYVWICMIPTRDAHAGIDGPRGRHKLVVLTICVIAAAPCLWLGLIARSEVWIAPALLLVLFARLAVRGPAPANDARA